MRLQTRRCSYTVATPVSSVEGRSAREAPVKSGQKVLVVSSYAPSLVSFRGRLIAAMIEHGHTVIAAAPAIDNSTAAAMRKLGAEVHTIPLQNVSLNPLTFFQSIRAMRSLLQRERPDTILAYTIKPIIISALARDKRTKTVVSLITGAGYAFTGGREAKRLVSCVAASLLYRIALRRSDVIVFQNRDDELLFRRLRLISPGRAAHIINGSGVDLADFSPAPLPERISFLMIARLLKDKGIREFAQAAKRLKASHPEVPIVLVGDFDPSPDSISRKDLDELIQCGVEYRGRLGDVRPAIAGCSVYVLPSYREGTPRSVLEAMAMARAIITTDAPGCRETVTPGVNGLLVRPRDWKSLFEAMVRFVREPALAAQMGPASRGIAEMKYDVRRVNSDLMRYAGLTC